MAKPAGQRRYEAYRRRRMRVDRGLYLLDWNSLSPTEQAGWYLAA
jgi:hypothetical protein